MYVKQGMDSYCILNKYRLQLIVYDYIEFQQKTFKIHDLWPLYFWHVQHMLSSQMTGVKECSKAIVHLIIQYFGLISC